MGVTPEFAKLGFRRRGEPGGGEMENRWRDEGAAECIARYGAEHGEDLALCLYASRLIGADPGLVLHGGGNTSFKGQRADILGELKQALFVKASGHDLATIEPEGLVAAGSREI